MRDDPRPAVEACAKLLPPSCAASFRAGKGDRCAPAGASGPEIRARFREWLKTDELLAAFDVLDQKRGFPFTVRSCDEPAIAPPIFPSEGTQADQYLRVLRDAKPLFAKCPPADALLRGTFVRFTIARSGRVCRVAGEAKTEGQKCFARQLERLVFPPPENGVVELSYPLNVDAR